jgi:hypothetical protein
MNNYFNNNFNYLISYFLFNRPILLFKSFNELDSILINSNEVETKGIFSLIYGAIFELFNEFLSKYSKLRNS